MCTRARATITQHANDATRPLVRYLFVAALRPFWRLALRWACTGRVRDLHGELLELNEPMDDDEVVDGQPVELRLPSFLKPVAFELLQCGVQVRQCALGSMARVVLPSPLILEDRGTPTAGLFQGTAAASRWRPSRATPTVRFPGEGHRTAASARLIQTHEAGTRQTVSIRI